MDIYTDGGCSGNPGVGAWAFIVIESQDDVVFHTQSDAVQYTTNNRMELRAVIEALSYAHKTFPTESIHLYSDSQYVCNGITNWINTWIKNQWKTAQKKAVKNKDLWVDLVERTHSLTIHWHWVKGHAHNIHNEQCHTLVQQSINILK